MDLIRETDLIKEIIEADLDNLNDDEIIDLLRKEFEVVKSNYQIINNISTLTFVDNRTIFKILDSYFHAPSLHATNILTLRLHKDLNDIVELECKLGYKLQDYLKYLYIHDFIYVPKQYTYTELDETQQDRLFQLQITRFRLEQAFEEIFESKKHLFKKEYFPVSKEDAIYMYLDNQIDSPTDLFKLFIEFGSLLDLLTSDESFSEIDNKGINLLNTKGYMDNLNLKREQEETLKRIENLNSELEKKEQELNSVKKEFEKLIQNQNDINLIQESKLSDFYQNIITILSILVAVLAIIGVNINSIPKIDKNFTINVITINASLILCISVMFFIIKTVVFNYSGKRLIPDLEYEKVKKDIENYFKKYFLAIVVSCVIFLGLSFYFGVVVEDNEVKVTEKRIEKISRDKLLIDRKAYEKLNQKIERYEDEIKDLKESIDKLQK
jgi:hypothetical protein